MKGKIEKWVGGRLTKLYMIILLVLVVFLLVFFMVYSDIKKRTVREFSNEQLILAKTAAQGITSFFDDYNASLTFLSQIQEVIDFNKGSEYYLEHFYQNRKEQIAAVTRIDEAGRIIYSVPYSNTLTGKDITSQKHVRQFLSTRKPVISDVFSAVQGYLAIAVYVPVFDDKQNFRGGIAVLIPISKLGEKYLGNINVRGTGSVWLLSENGVEIFCPHDQHVGHDFLTNVNNHKLAVELLSKIRDNESGNVNGVHYGNHNDNSTEMMVKYITFYKARIGNTYWTILISCNEEDIYADLKSLRNRLIIIFLLLLIPISYYFYSITKVQNVLFEEEKRKKAEKTLRESEEKFRTVFNESPVGIELYNSEGELINANRSSLSMFGVSDVDDIRYFNIFDSISLDDEKKRKLQEGKIVSYQYEFDFDTAEWPENIKTSRSGKAYFDYTITPLLDHNSIYINGYLLQVQDVTERIKAGAEIMMLAHSLKSVNECVSITDMENRILFVNETFLKTYGYSFDELKGKNIELLRSQNNSPEITERIWPETIGQGWKGELLNKRKDGTEFPVYLSTTTVRDKNGEVIALIGIASDITERKLFEKELIETRERALESDSLKSAFLANMSHEIRTPMNGIIGFTNLLSEPGLTTTEIREYINIIQKSGKRMLNTVNDLIDISKIETGQMKLFYDEISVKDQLLNLYNFFLPEVKEKKLQFILKDNIAINAIVRTDVSKLDSILTNLIKNAIKYTDSGSIEIGVSLGERNLEMYVKDTGIGIPYNRQKAIFNRFEQVENGDTRSYEGAGLGLAIVKAYVEMLGGEIDLKSEPGVGSVFSIYIPVDTILVETEEFNQQKQQITNMKQDSGLKILIVEDDPVGMQFLKAVLIPFQAEFLIAVNGSEAIEILKKNPGIDIILMDLRMPVLDGYEATRQIREFNQDVYIIAQTAFALSGDKEKAIDAGCNDYISKPIIKTELYEKINQYLDRS